MAVWLALLLLVHCLEKATENNLDDGLHDLYEAKLPPFNSENILANIFIGSWNSTYLSMYHDFNRLPITVSKCRF